MIPNQKSNTAFKSIFIGSSERLYLQKAMKATSRSFALVTPCFEEPFDAVMSAAYLVFRVADNIEDCFYSDREKKDLYEKLRILIRDSTSVEDIYERWSELDWPGLTTEERQLMSKDGGVQLWEIFFSFPDFVQTSIARWLEEMIVGTLELAESSDRGQNLLVEEVTILASEDIYNRYCYFVAGTVGRMGTELANSFYEIVPQQAEKLSQLSEDCGRALQKTNIVKDFEKDLSERKLCYLPKSWMDEVELSPLKLEDAPLQWKRMVILDALESANKSVEYVLTIPENATGFKLASLMCLLPAYQTLLFASQNHQTLFTPKHHVKISRETFSQCFTDAKSMLKGDRQLQEYSENLQEQIETALR